LVNLRYVPAYGHNSSNRDIATRIVRDAVDIPTAYADKHKHFNVNLVFIGAEEASIGRDTAARRNFLLEESVPAQRAALARAPDISGIGRWFVMELVARLRTEEAGCVIVADTLRNFIRVSLVPHSERKTCVEWLYAAEGNREDRLSVADAPFFAAHAHELDPELLMHTQKAYASCLQSTSVLLWREDERSLLADSDTEEEAEAEADGQAAISVDEEDDADQQ
jgi:hypothetical protein